MLAESPVGSENCSAEIAPPTGDGNMRSLAVCRAGFATFLADCGDDETQAALHPYESSVLFAEPHQTRGIRGGLETDLFGELRETALNVLWPEVGGALAEPSENRFPLPAIRAGRVRARQADLRQG